MEIAFQTSSQTSSLLYKMYAQTHGFRTSLPFVRFADITQSVESLTSDRIRKFPDVPLSEHEIFNRLKDFNPNIFSTQANANDELNEIKVLLRNFKKILIICYLLMKIMKLLIKLVIQLIARI